MNKAPRIRISENELRGKFNRNEGGNPARRARLKVRRVYDEPASPMSKQEPGTRSIVDSYYDETDRKVMTLHHFLRPNGTLGGSGKPDPKELLVDGIMYYK
jgi:hypothetical protein